MQDFTPSASLTQSIDSAAVLPTPFEPMRFLQQWIVYELHSPQGGKYQKRPIDHRTGRVPAKGHGGPEIWTSFETAAAVAAKLGQLYGVGFYFTEADPFWFLDIDECAILNAEGRTIGWSQFAGDLCARFPGAAVEVSSSHRGLHVIGSGKAPPHDCRNTERHIEFYTADRWVALTGINAQGSAATDHTGAVVALVAEFFPQSESADTGGELTTEPSPMWHGPTDNDALLKIAMRSRSAASMFNPRDAKPTFKQLWNADVDKLAKTWPPDKPHEAYNASHADQSLACHLAWYTGGNGERVLELMKQSLLDRSKWDERDDYLRRTIIKACAWQKTFYNDGKGIKAGADIPVTHADAKGIALDDFYAYLPQMSYMFVPTRELWPAGAVDASVPWINGNPPSNWLDRARPLHQMTWAPGEPLVIADKIVAGGGWIPDLGLNCFNLYRPPAVMNGGDPSKATPWLDLMKFVFPDDWEHITRWFAHRRQRPGEKINHGLVLGGTPGIGKDTIIEPLKPAVGAWNFTEISPKDLLGDFNGYLKSVVLRVSEARDQGEMNRYALYEHTKTMLAAPPETLRCNEKNLREHPVFNVMGVIFTTNHKDGLYLPPDDRRHYVAWSPRDQKDFQDGYFLAMWNWYNAGGYAHVIAYLDSIDLAGFDPKASPPKTPAFWVMVDAGRAPEDSQMADALERLGNPPAVTVEQVRTAAMTGDASFFGWLNDKKNDRAIPRRFEAAGYGQVRNRDAKDGYWKIGGKRMTVYARKELSDREQIAAAAALR